MVKELQIILKRLNTMLSVIENSPDTSDTGVIVLRDIKTTSRILDKLWATIDILSGEVANLIEIEKEK